MGSPWVCRVKAPRAAEELSVPRDRDPPATPVLAEPPWGRHLTRSGPHSSLSSVSFTLSWRSDHGEEERGNALASKGGVQVQETDTLPTAAHRPLCSAICLPPTSYPKHSCHLRPSHLRLPLCLEDRLPLGSCSPSRASQEGAWPSFTRTPRPPAQIPRSELPPSPFLLPPPAIVPTAKRRDPSASMSAR